MKLRRTGASLAVVASVAWRTVQQSRMSAANVAHIVSVML
jgi:hypothetical protein